MDTHSTVATLQEKGLSNDQSFTTEAELTDATRLFNQQHQARGGKTALEIKRAVVMLLDGDMSDNCQIVEFANSNQAEEYTKYYIATRDEYSAYVIAQEGPYIVLTTLKVVLETVPLTFN